MTLYCSRCMQEAAERSLTEVVYMGGARAHFHNRWLRDCLREEEAELGYELDRVIPGRRLTSFVRYPSLVQRTAPAAV